MLKYEIYMNYTMILVFISLVDGLEIRIEKHIQTIYGIAVKSVVEKY